MQQLSKDYFYQTELTRIFQNYHYSGISVIVLLHSTYLSCVDDPRQHSWHRENLMEWKLGNSAQNHPYKL